MAAQGTQHTNCLHNIQDDTAIGWRDAVCSRVSSVVRNRNSLGLNENVSCFNPFIAYKINNVFNQELKLMLFVVRLLPGFEVQT